MPRLKIVAPKVEGTINLVGARLDDLVLRDYHQEVSTESPLVRLLEPRVDPQPYYVQFGWTGDGVALPGPETVWTAEGGELAPGKKVNLSWDNKAGQVFKIGLTVDDNYMFGIEQSVQNNGSAAIKLYPWSRIRRDYKPLTSGYYILHEGLLGVLNGTLQEQTYDKAKTESEKTKGASLKTETTGGWAGITDKYWLTALIPDQAVPVTASFRHVTENGADRYQVDFMPNKRAGHRARCRRHHDLAPVRRRQGGAVAGSVRERVPHPELRQGGRFRLVLFPDEADLLRHRLLLSPDRQFRRCHHAVHRDREGVVFPAGQQVVSSMSKMKLLAPKMTEIRERLKDEPQKMQAEIMQLYKAEKVNPASGCLPMVVQIPVFFSLYKVIFVTIEMRHAPFFGWIHDLSAVDPTNIFTLFGLIPWDPTHYSHFLHLGLWPLIMGVTMFFQQKLNPAPPDPVQARIFQFMPIIFTFMLSSFPAGLVIYWSWNNTLTILQQWTIMRRTRLPKPELARP